MICLNCSLDNCGIRSRFVEDLRKGPMQYSRVFRSYIFVRLPSYGQFVQ